MFNIPEILEVARIGQCIQVNDLIFRILCYEEPDYMGADEAGSAGNNDGFGSVHG